ncbi:hypothetical protein ACLB2K_058453 [Fragaria x ananassa]
MHSMHCLPGKEEFKSSLLVLVAQLTLQVSNLWSKQGMVATSTFPLPVIGVPLRASTLDGVDSVLYGSLVATVAINNAANAGLLEVQMLAVYDADLFVRISQYQEDTKSEILAEDEKLQKIGCESYLNP